MKSKRKSTASDSARQRLLAAGRKLFAQKTYDQVAIDDIAREAGVAHGLLFHYFKSKLGFYVQVYHADRDEMLKKRSEATSEGTGDQRLRRFVAFHMQHVREWAGSHVYILRGGAPAKVLQEAEASRMAGVREVLSYFSSDPPTEEDLILGRAWLALQGEILLAWIQNEKLDSDGVLEACVELYYETMKRKKLIRISKANVSTLQPRKAMKPAIGTRSAKAAQLS